MKLLLAGDTHGDAANINHLFNKAKGNDCEKILVLGDFGHFPHLKSGRTFYNEISRSAIKNGIELHWIKGNHDNHHDLKQYSGCVELHPNIFFHQNLNVWTWGKYTFCAIGGAHSIDKECRTEEIDWWSNEQISLSDIEGAAHIQSPVDVVLSHDCPISVDISKYLDYKRDIKTHGNRQKLQDIVEILKPKMLFHGHYHQRIDSTGIHPEDTFQSVGLGSNVNPRDKQSYILNCG